MKVIGFGHRKFVGKDTAANFLVTHLRMIHRGKNIKKISLATEVKRISFDLFSYLGLKEGSYYEENVKLKDIPLSLNPKLTPRDIWIAVGNTMRQIDMDVWLYKIISNKCDFLIISDIRYLNEVEFVKKHGIAIKIERDLPKSDDPADSALKDYKGWDEIMNNDLSLHDLDYQIQSFAEGLL